MSALPICTCKLQPDGLRFMVVCPVHDAPPIWTQSPHTFRWLKLLLECGLAEDGPEAEALIQRSPFHPPPEPTPRDAEVLAWARGQLRKIVQL